MPRREGRRSRRGLLSRPGAHCETLLHQLLEESVECLVQDDGQLTVRNAVAKEVLCLFDLVAKGTRRRKGNLEGVLRKGGDDGALLPSTNRRDRRSGTAPRNRRWRGRLRLEQGGRSTARQLSHDVRNRRLW